MEKCITQSWVEHTWKFMWEKNIIVQEITPSFQPQRANDSLITEDLIKAGFKGNKLSEINRCRVYLKVTCLSDVSTWDDLSISH